MTRVAIAGAAGRMGKTLIEAVTLSEANLKVGLGTVLADDPAAGVDLGLLAGISALGIAWGMTHLEVYLTENGPLFGEIALRPPGGYIMNAISHAWDFNPWAAFVAMELGEVFNFPEQVSQFAASEVLYPGAGIVSAVSGKSRVLEEQGVREFRLKVKVGEQLPARTGLGHDTGYVVHASASPEERLTLHELIERELTIEVAALDGQG